MQNYGLIREGKGNAVLRAIPVPKIPDDCLLVKTVAIALNPTDWTSIDAVGNNGTLVGCDYAGIVEQVGKAVTKNFKKGDRVAGTGHGANDANPATGTFARYIVVKGDLQIHVPDSVSFEAASAVGCGLSTVGLAMYKYLGLPWPESGKDANKMPVLIYGGSTATGTLAVQFAKMSGCKVITTCSPKHFDMMKDRGADAVYDYHIADIGAQIRKDTDGQITNVLDTVSTEETAAICAAAIGPSGGHYCNLLGVDCARPDVKSSFFLGYSIFGDSYIYEGDAFPASPEDFTFGRDFLNLSEKMWKEGKVKPHPLRVGMEGLRGAVKGMDEMRHGRYSGEKLVYLVDETEWPVAGQ